MTSSIENIKDQFPIFGETLKGWSYLDNAATTQKPESVIRAINNFYLKENANIHRGLYDLSTLATRHFEEVRSKVKGFIGASSDKEIAFTSGTTESINIVAHSFQQTLEPGDEILISAMEHHSNLIPWQQACQQRKASLRIIPVNTSGDLDMVALKTLLTKNTKLVAVAHLSNTLGTINPIKEIADLSHEKKIPVLIDAAQSVSHMTLRVSELDCDFMAFSSHKMFGPMGTGVLFVKKKYHDFMQPLFYGGGAIKQVGFNETKFREFPYSVEAGTPHVAGVIGLGVAIDFIQDLKMDDVKNHNYHLASLVRDNLKSLTGISVIGNPKEFSGIVAFAVEGIHAHDVASFLSDKKIAVRAGHHCTQPLHDQLGLPATVRASFSIYNSKADAERLIEALSDIKKFWS